MNKGLKVFSKLQNVYLQAEIIPSHIQNFKNKYAMRSKKLTKLNDFFNRKKGKTAWGDAYRIFFNTTEDWVIESLQKLGFHITQNGNGFSICNKDIKTDNMATNEDFFWKLVDFGYELGKNETVEYKD